MTLKNLIQYLDDISTISNRQNFDIRKLYGDGGNRTRVRRRIAGSSPGAVRVGVFSVPTIPRTRRRRTQSL